MTAPDLASKIQHAAQLIRIAQHAVVITGAGISTPSGIPDFRSAGSGLWTKDNPMRVASLTTFQRSPERFFAWLRSLVIPIRKASPNPAHYALAKMEQVGVIKAVITQNIDGLHQQAGSQVVIELHGSLSTLTCPHCRTQVKAGEFIETFAQSNRLPYCSLCRSLLKPDIILFEETLPIDTWDAAQMHCQQADLVLVVGSSLEVSPANQLPLYALQHDARLIINTFSPTYLDDAAHILISGDVVTILPQIAAQIDG
ncbi:MAG TPA: NAD-dependent deacylase [Levilinea sp.]|nr:NAD-dependent deacylase [Levilinea sp.]